MTYLQKFINRELKQGAHLRKALRGRYQKTFTRPRRELRRLGISRVKSLIAHNPYSRARWLEAVVRRLRKVVGASLPGYLLQRPLYLVTIIDRLQIINPDPEEWWRDRNPTWEEIRRAYRQHLFGLDYFGMLDTALFVSTQRVFNCDRLVHVHQHALVWNTTEAKLDAICERARGRIWPLFSYTSVVRYSPVEPTDFLQVTWYVNKTPRKQYQIFSRETGRFKQYKGPINGVNAVRLYKVLRDVSLDELVLVGGEGQNVLDMVLRDCKRR